MESIQFFVEGEPATKGSTRSFITDYEWARAMRESNKPRIITQPDNKRSKPWAKTIAHFACQHIEAVHTGPVQVQLEFVIRRPKKPSHIYPQGDTDKLERCVLDALTGVAYRDDVQVVDSHSTKRYSRTIAGVQIKLCFLDGWAEYESGG